MTTKAEIRRWARPFLEWRQDLVLEHRLLLLCPVRHIMRGIYFAPSSRKDYPKVGWFMHALCIAPTPWGGVRLTCDIPVGSSQRAGFKETLERRGRQSIEEFVGPIDTIRKFRDYAVVARKPFEGGFDSLTLDRYPREYAPVLAALGQLKDAQAILAPAIEADEAYARRQLRDGQLILAKRPNSPTGHELVQLAMDRLAVVARLRELLALLEANDRSGTAALLHQWERENVMRRSIEHLWEPTPFPLEGAED